MLSQKVSRFTFYLRKFHVSYFISESCVLQIILAFSTVFVNHVSTHRHATVFVNNVFLPTANKQTDIWVQGQLKLRTLQNLTNTRQYGKTLRVEFTLTKLQEDHSEQESSRQITLARKIIKITRKAAKTKDLKFQTKLARQINTPRLCKSHLK